MTIRSGLQTGNHGGMTGADGGNLPGLAVFFFVIKAACGLGAFSRPALIARKTLNRPILLHGLWSFYTSCFQLENVAS